MLNSLELNAPNELIRWVHAASRDAIAQLAKIVFQVAETGDTSAEQIVNSAVDELAGAVEVVIKQLEFTMPFDVVFSGGNLLHQPMFADKLRCRLGTITERASAVLPRHEPAYGAVLLARANL